MSSHLLAAVPRGEHFPILQPRTCTSDRVARIPKILWQTGRGNSVREHNRMNASDFRRQRRLLQSDRIRTRYHNDSTAREFVRRHCPYAYNAYTCLLPHSYKADLWRYCVLWKRGGWYLDAEDELLVPLSSLPLRRCDTLMLVNDLCPAGYGADPKQEWKHCQTPAVQISLMAATPGHLFFRCALALLIRNVHRRVRGRGTLDTTGPVLSGACLQHFHNQLSNYSMQLVLAPDVERNTNSGAGGSSSKPAGHVAIFHAQPIGNGHVNHTRVVRVHAWKGPNRPKESTYAAAWEAGRVFGDAAGGCALPPATTARRWVPGSASRLGRYWDMVV